MSADETRTVEDLWREIHGDLVCYRTATRKTHICGDCRRTIEGRRALPRHGGADRHLADGEGL